MCSVQVHCLGEALEGIVPQKNRSSWESLLGVICKTHFIKCSIVLSKSPVSFTDLVPLLCLLLSPPVPFAQEWGRGHLVPRLCAPVLIDLIWIALMELCKAEIFSTPFPYIVMFGLSIKSAVGRMSHSKIHQPSFL